MRNLPLPAPCRVSEFYAAARHTRVTRPGSSRRARRWSSDVASEAAPGPVWPPC